MDQTDTGRLAKMGVLAPLEAKDYPFADIPAQIADPKLSSLDGVLYTVPEKFGYNTVAFDKIGRAGIGDDGYPGALGRRSTRTGSRSMTTTCPRSNMWPWRWARIRRRSAMPICPAIKEKLAALKANAAMVGDVTAVQQALATGAVDILVGGGEWVTAGMAKDKPSLDYIIPKQGGIRWQQGLGVFAGSKNKDLGTKFIQYILSPEGQGRLATSSCYWGMPANSKAVLTPEQKTILRWDDQPGYIKVSYPYLQMTPEMDQKLQALWAQVMQGK